MTLQEKLNAWLEIEGKRHLIDGRCQECDFDVLCYRHSYQCSKPENVFETHAANTYQPLCRALLRAVEGIERERGLTMRYTFKWNALTDILTDIERVLEKK